MSKEAESIPPTAAVLQVLAGFWSARAVYAAAKLGIADLVDDGPQTAAELARQTGTDEASLYRLLRALAGIGWLSQDQGGRFGPTPLTAGIRTGAPGSLRHLAMTELGEEHYPAWEDLLFSLRTGEKAFDHVFGMTNWDFWASHPENAAIFNRAMSEMTAVIEPAILEAYDFSRFGTIVDVGGGRGTLIASILEACPDSRGIVLDLPHVIEMGKDHLVERGLASRAELRAGSFFDSVPAGGDAYLLKWILHDWNDEECARILRNCHRAMPPDGKLIVIEAVVPDGNVPFLHKLIDLNMLVMTGGRERTEDEYRSLFAAGGFRLVRVERTPLEVAVLECARDSAVEER